MEACYLLFAACLASSDKPADQQPEPPAIAKVEPSRAGLRDTITVTVANPPKGAQSENWILYLDGIPLKGIHPENQDFLRRGELRFRLERNDASKESWLRLLRGVQLDRSVDLALGTEKEVDLSIAPLPGKFKLVVLPETRLVAYLIGLGALLVAMVLLSRQSTLLRNRDMIAASGEQPPFSLGLTQMAFWFFLVIAGYLFIGIVTWNFTESIPTSVLVLLGIAAGTALGAVTIDADKSRRRRNLENERRELTSQLQAPDSNEANATDSEKQQLQAAKDQKTKRIGEIGTALQSLPAVSAGSKRFFYDLVSDDTGVSLHRFQIVCWTAILGVVFVVEVIKNLAMPDFNQTLLALMGISSGTYLGFKFDERKA